MVEAADLEVAEVAVDFAAVVAAAEEPSAVAEAAVHSAVGAVSGAEVAVSEAADMAAASVEASAGTDGMEAATVMGAAFGAATDSFLASATRPGIGPVMPMILTITDTPMGILVIPMDILVTTDTIRMLTADTMGTDRMLLIRCHLLSMVEP